METKVVSFPLTRNRRHAPDTSDDRLAAAPSILPLTRLVAVDIATALPPQNGKVMTLADVRRGIEWLKASGVPDFCGTFVACLSG